MKNYYRVKKWIAILIVLLILTLIIFLLYYLLNRDYVTDVNISDDISDGELAEEEDYELEQLEEDKGTQDIPSSLDELSQSICSTGQVLKKAGSMNWVCADDEVGYFDHSGYIEDVQTGDGIVKTGSSEVPVLSVETDGVTLTILGSGLSIADDAITTEKIANGTILFGDIARNGCEANQIMQWDGSDWTCVYSSGVLTEDDVEAFVFDSDNTGTLNSGTLALDSLSYTGDLNDSNISNTITVSSLGSVDKAAISGGILSFDWTDDEVVDSLTVDATGSVVWASLNSYPGACAAGNAITQIGDTLTCTAFWDSISDVPIAVPSDGDTTHLSTSDQIYDFVLGLGYITDDTSVEKGHLVNSGVLSFDWADDEVVDGLTISGGSVNVNSFSAYSDLSSENFLDNDADGDILIRSQLDSRYLSFVTIDAPSGSDPVAEIYNDTLVFAEGDNITITGDSGLDTITVAVVDGTGSSLDADTIDALNSLSFLRSDASDIYESGNALTFDGSVDFNGDVTLTDQVVVFDAATFSSLEITGELRILVGGDTDDYIYLNTASDVAGLFWAGTGAATDPGIYSNGTELGYRDEADAWVSFDSLINSNVITSVYNETTSKSDVIIWTGTATTSSGQATFYPTDDGTGSGNAIFTNIYSVQAIAERDTTVAREFVFSSLRSISGDNKTVIINAGTGTTVVLGGNTIDDAPDSTTVYLTIIGD